MPERKGPFLLCKMLSDCPLQTLYILFQLETKSKNPDQIGSKNHQPTEQDAVNFGAIEKNLIEIFCKETQLQNYQEYPAKVIELVVFIVMFLAVNLLLNLCSGSWFQDGICEQMYSVWLDSVNPNHWK